MKKWSKNKSEEIYFEIFKKFTKELDGLDFVHKDAPDFLIKLPDGFLGLEVTRIFQNKGFKGRPEWEIESEEFNVVQGARELAVENNVSPMMVSVFFSKEFRPNKRCRDKIAKALFNTIEKNIPPEGSEGKELGRRDGLPREVEAVTLHRFSCLSDHCWDAAAGGMVLENCIPEIQKRLDEKEGKIDAYLKKCEKCWLLIVADWEINASALIAPSVETQDKRFITSFERVYFLDPILGRVLRLQTSGHMT